MPRFNSILQTFQNGEVSPRAYGRTDFDAYKRSCKNILNMWVHPQGGASRRVGTQFITDEMTDGSSQLEFLEDAQCIPFVVSQDEAYVIIFPARVTTGIINPLNPYIYIYNINEESFTTVEHQTAVGSSTSGFKNGLAASKDIIKEIQYVQTGDVLFFTHGKIPPQVIRRVGVNEFEWDDYWAVAGTFSNANGIGPVDNLVGQGFRSPNVDANLKIEASAATGTGITLESSDDFFDVGHIGALFAFQDSSTVGWAVITGYTSATQVTANVIDTLPSAATATGGTAQWIEGAWSTYRGFPKAVTLWNGRLFFGGTDTDPYGIWASQIFDLFEMANENILDPGYTLTASDPQFFTVASDRANYITWMSGGKSDLLVGTRGREYAIKSFDIGNVDVRPQTGYGSEYIQPIIVDDVPVYVQRGFRKLREIMYDDRTAGYLSPEVTFLAEHLPRKSMSIFAGAASSKITRLAYQALDNNILWALDNNGYLFGATKDRGNAVTAFHRHHLGGVHDSSLNEPPKVLSMCAAPAKTGVSDELYLLVKREINGESVVSFEKIGVDFYEVSLDQDISDKTRIPIFMDYAKIFRPSTGHAFYARLYDDIDANEAAGSVAATSTGTVTFINGKAKLDASTASYLDYSAVDNANFAQEGTIEWTWWPLNVGTAQCMITVCTANNDAYNLIEVYTDTDNNIYLNVLDSAGMDIINDVNLGQWCAGNRTPHHFSLRYNFTDGATALFCNGKKLGTTQSGTGTRSSAAITLLRVGAKYDGTLPGQANLVGDVVVYDYSKGTLEQTLFEFQPASETLTRLEYLEGEEVQVLGDGKYLGKFIVDNGEVLLDDVYSTIVVGLPYRNLLNPQSVEEGSGIGTAQGSKTRIDRVTPKFNASAQGQIGRDLDHLEPISFRNDGEDPENPITLYTGEKPVYFDGEYVNESSFYLVGDDPLPMNVTAIVIRGVTYD